MVKWKIWTEIEEWLFINYAYLPRQMRNTSGIDGRFLHATAGADGVTIASNMRQAGMRIMGFEKKV